MADNINFVISAPLYRESSSFREFVNEVMEEYTMDPEMFFEEHGDFSTKNLNLIEMYYDDDDRPTIVDEAFIYLATNEDGLIMGVNKEAKAFEKEECLSLFSKYSFMRTMYDFDCSLEVTLFLVDNILTVKSVVFPKYEGDNEITHTFLYEKVSTSEIFDFIRDVEKEDSLVFAHEI